MRHAAVLAAILLATTTRTAAAQQFALEVDARASAVTLDGSFSVALPGSLIGDWDRVDNPGGTRTVPGLFGGDGNEPVPTEFGLGLASAADAAPQGSLGLAVDLPALAATVEGLALDLLGGEVASGALTLSLLFQTFRTYQPDSLYIGGFPLDLPLGEQTLADVQLVQTAAAAGALTPTEDAGVFGFAALVPAELSFTVDLAGAPVPVGPLPVALPLVGTLEVSGGVATLGLALDLTLAETIRDPLPGFALEDLPLDLPTLLPPGDTAHLLLSATIATLGVTADLSLAIVAEGSAPCGIEPYCSANPNSTGAAASLTATGSADLADADLVFAASALPPARMALLVTAASEAWVPTYRGHAGSLCLGPRFVRLTAPPLESDADGNLRHALDFAALPPGADFAPGATWHFQLWVRDADPLPTWNSTNGVRVRFCPPR